MPQALSGLSGISGVTPIDISDPFATPEERMGGPANPYHAQLGEQARPYAWESHQMQTAGHGPYGADNQLLSDPTWFIQEGGSLSDDPLADHNTPTLTKSHASVRNLTISGPLPSQHDAINLQADQMGKKLSDLGTSRNMSHDQQGYALQDQWTEIWEVNPGNLERPAVDGSVAYQANGFGANDNVTNPYHKANQYGLDSKHMHRRFATGSIPGNYMWLRPRGRPMHRNLPGPARPAIGYDSPFTGDDLGYAFSYDTGAILTAQPTEYIPPPAVNVAPVTPTYASAYGTDGVELW